MATKYPAGHPFRSKAAHERLLQFLKARLDYGHEYRKPLVERFREIDNDIAGFLRLDREDSKRRAKNRSGRGELWVTTKAQFAMSQLTDMVTDLMDIFAPDGEFYRAIANPEKQTPAMAFTYIMNRMAQEGRYYRHYSRFLMNTLKYNLGAMLVEWERVYGNKIEVTQDGQVSAAPSTLVREGNALRALDMYNVIFDPSVAPVDCPSQGEYAAVVERHTTFRVKKLLADGVLTNLDQDFFKGLNSQNYSSYYELPPEIRDGGKAVQDWGSIFGGTTTREERNAIELVHMFCWIIPSAFGLSSSNDYQIWRFTIANGQQVCSAEWMNNAHALLPIVFATPIEDDLGMQQKSYAEQLIPHQRFANHLINVHAHANRKSLYGVTVYDPSKVDLSEADDGVCGMIPLKATAYGEPVQNVLYNHNIAPKTDHTTTDLARTLELMQRILPTDRSRSVGDLDRATQYQSAATVQASNRRTKSLAKIVDDQAFTFVRHMQMYNIMQYLPQIPVINANGETELVSPANFRDAELEFDVSEGMRGVDRLTIVASIRDVIYAILQSQSALQQIDVVALLDYWTAMMGDKTNLTRFKVKSPLMQFINSMTPEQQNQVYAMLQQAFTSQTQAQNEPAGA